MITTSMTDEEYLRYLTPETKAECELVKRLEATLGAEDRGDLESQISELSIDKDDLEDELSEAQQEVAELRTIIAKLEAGGACDA